MFSGLPPKADLRYLKMPKRHGHYARSIPALAMMSR